MNNIFANLVNMFTQTMVGVYRRQHNAWSLKEAVSAASMMCSTNPARLLGISDWCGQVSIGKRANLVLVDIRERESRPQEDNEVGHKEQLGCCDRYVVEIKRVWC